MPPPEPVMGFRVPPTCGNGVVDPGEQCDNGSNLPESCCDPLCRLVASGTSCGPANCIATHACDGAGTCVTGPPVPCDQCSRCAFGGGLPIECVADPATSCRAPTAVGAAQLILKTTQPGQFKVTKSSLKWKWAKGQATALADFGDPVHV